MSAFPFALLTPDQQAIQDRLNATYPHGIVDQNTALSPPPQDAIGSNNPLAIPGAILNGASNDNGVLADSWNRLSGFGKLLIGPIGQIFGIDPGVAAAQLTSGKSVQQLKLEGIAGWGIERIVILLIGLLLLGIGLFGLRPVQNTVISLGKKAATVAAA